MPFPGGRGAGGPGVMGMPMKGQGRGLNKGGPKGQYQNNNQGGNQQYQQRGGAGRGQGGKYQ